LKIDSLQRSTETSNLGFYSIEVNIFLSSKTFQLAFLFCYLFRQVSVVGDVAVEVVSAVVVDARPEVQEFSAHVQDQF